VNGPRHVCPRGGPQALGSLLPTRVRPRSTFTAGAISMVVSGHTLLCTLTPCGVLIHAAPPTVYTPGRAAWTGSVDTNITESCAGHTPLAVWGSGVRVPSAPLQNRR
jgi:hypothetical protein